MSVEHDSDNQGHADHDGEGEHERHVHRDDYARAGGRRRTGTGRVEQSKISSG